MNQRSTPSLLSIWQLIFSLLAALGLWGMAALIAVFGFFNRTGGEAVLQTWPAQAFSLFACGLLLLPSVLTPLLRLLGRSLPPQFAPLLQIHPLWVLLAVGITLGLGYLMMRFNGRSAWVGIAFPLLNVLAVTLPALFFVNLGARKLASGTLQRRSGVFGAGLTLGPLLILLAETAGLVIAVILALLASSDLSGLLAALESFSRDLAVVQSDSESLLQALEPYLSDPRLIGAVLLYAAVFVPLVEELLKPIGVWFLAGRTITPAEGFSAGLLSGAGYAIFESIVISSNLNQDWLFVVVARSGTHVLHILTTALSGWALAHAWGERRYGRLLLTYLGVTLLHGAWNAVSLLAFFSEALAESGSGLPAGPLATLVDLSSMVTPVVLVALATLATILLIVMNRRLRRTPAAGLPVEAEPLGVENGVDPNAG